MNPDSVSSAERFESHRRRLERRCAYLTGANDEAEDLAQETLFEAWRHRDRLIDPSGETAWLNAIASNVCRRWRSDRNSHRLPPTKPLEEIGAPSFSSEDRPTIEEEILHNLSRKELSRLLDAALGLLPIETRATLISRYVEELPRQEIAARLSLTDGAVALRLHRGRLALRRLLETEFREDALALGVAVDEVPWKTTRLWCPMCGQARLEAFFRRREPLHFTLRCPRCNRQPETCVVNLADCKVDPLRHARSYRAALVKTVEIFQRSRCLRSPMDGWVCTSCQRAIPDSQIQRLPHPDAHEQSNLFAICPHCGSINSSTVGGQALVHPSAFALWQECDRIRVLPPRQITYSGKVALLVSIDAIAQNKRVDVTFDAETLLLIDAFPA